jgi:hypothetical protein
LAKVKAADPGAYDVVQKLLSQKAAGLLRVGSSAAAPVYGTEEDAEAEGRRSAKSMEVNGEVAGITRRGRGFFGWKPKSVDNDQVMSVLEQRRPEVTTVDDDDTTNATPVADSQTDALFRRGSLLSAQATLESGAEQTAARAAMRSTVKGLAAATAPNGMYEADNSHFTSAERLLSSEAAQDVESDSKVPNPYSVNMNWAQDGVVKKRSALADFNTRVSRSYLSQFSWKQ